MTSIFFQPETPSFSISSIDRCIEEAQALILKWNPETSEYARVTSLFIEYKTEAMHYIKCVNQLHKAMHLLISQNPPSSEKLSLANNLMQMAMKRLQKEFYQILSINGAHLDPKSVSSTRSSLSHATSLHSGTSDYDDDATAPDDDVRAAGDSISESEQVSSVAMMDLRSIAECMISCGYAKECVSVYKIIRKSIIDEGIYRLNIEKMSSSRINKMDWQVLELKIKTWLEAVKISVRTLFNGERILCDYVFATSESIRESCFTDISRDGATLLFAFPELISKTKKPLPEKMFRVLDMYNAIIALLPEIQSIFSFKSTSGITSQVLLRLSNSVRTMLSEFEYKIQKDSSKSRLREGGVHPLTTEIQSIFSFKSTSGITSQVLLRLSNSVRTMLSQFEYKIQKDSSKSRLREGGVHPLTTQAINYLSLLANYSDTLSDIFADWSPPPKSPLPESLLLLCLDSDDTSAATAFSAKIAWLILVLLCKLDSKAKHYKDVSSSYMFLANNLQHVIDAARNSNLQYVLGDEWIVKHEAKMKGLVMKYEKVAWGEVFSCLPENPKAVISTEEAKEIFRNFSFYFEEAHRKQNSLRVPDRTLRNELKASIARKVVPIYREFYNAHSVGPVRDMTLYVTFSPDDVEDYLANLFFEEGSSDSVTGSSSLSSITSSSHQQHSLAHSLEHRTD